MIFGGQPFTAFQSNKPIWPPGYIAEKRTGPRTEPCGTPDVTHILFDRVPLTETLYFRCERNDFIKFLVFPVILQKANFDKTLAKSSRMTSIYVIQSWTVSMSCDSQDSPDWKPCWKWRMMLCLCVSTCC